MHGINTLTLALALLPCLFAPTGCASDSPTTTSPDPTQPNTSHHFNVLLVVIDTLRADHLGCYGYARDTSPNIDALATRSVVFDQALANSDGTILTHISLLSSRYPGPREVGPGPTITLAEAFAGAGYQTYGISANPALLPVSGWARGFDYYTDRPVDDDTLDRIKDDPNYSKQIEVRSAQQTSDFVLASLRRHADNNSDRPWFLFVNYLDPHDPYTERKPWSDQFRQSPSAISGTLRPTAGRTIWNWVAQTLPTLTDHDVQRLGELYDAEIRYTDLHLQRVFDYLTQTGQTQNTIVLITSDHGELLGEHRMFTHMIAALEPEIRVPLILHLPGPNTPQLRSDDLVESVDVAPTLLALAGIPIPDAFQGKTLLGPDGQLRHTRRSHTLHIHHAVNRKQRRELNFPPVSANDSVMLRFNAGKLYLLPDNSYLFFDLDDRPVLEPDSRLDRILSTLTRSEFPRPPDITEMPQQTKDALHSLGYLKQD